MAQRGAVRYTGTADIKEFTAQQQRSAGLGGSDPVTLTWTKANGFRLPSDRFDYLSDEDFTRLIELDPSLVVEDE